MDGFGVVLLLLAIFILPEIKNMYKKKQAYKYPDEGQEEQAGKGNSTPMAEGQKHKVEIDWDEIFGLESNTSENMVLEQKTEKPKPDDLPKPEVARVAVPENIPVLNVSREKQVKISARQALQGLIMAEVLAKPRAMRPLEPLQFPKHKKVK